MFVFKLCSRLFFHDGTLQATVVGLAFVLEICACSRYIRDVMSEHSMVLTSSTDSAVGVARLYIKSLTCRRKQFCSRVSECEASVVPSWPTRLSAILVIEKILVVLFLVAHGVNVGTKTGLFTASRNLHC